MRFLPDEDDEHPFPRWDPPKTDEGRDTEGPDKVATSKNETPGSLALATAGCNEGTRGVP
jgi:hypothetical protein